MDKNGRGENRIDENWTIEGKIMDLQVDACNDVIGVNASRFSTQLGVIARDGNKLPLTYTDWRLVPNTAKERIWLEVKGNTNLPSTYKSKCLRKVGKLWRDWKSNVKSTYYKPHRRDLKSLLKNCPDRVEQDQWPELVKMWSSDKVKFRSKVNRRNRGNQTMPHRTGRKGFGNVRAELREELHAEPSKLDLFLKTRQAKEGKSVDEATLEILNKAREMKEKLPESERDDISKNDDIYHSLLGPEKAGRLQTYGARDYATSMGNTHVQLSEEWKRFIDDTLKEKVSLLFDDIKSDIERKFVDMMELRISEFIERNLSKDMANHRVEVHKDTTVHTIEEEHDIVHEELYNKDMTYILRINESACEAGDIHQNKVSYIQPNKHVDVDSSRIFGSKRCQIYSADEETTNVVLKKNKQK